MAISAATVFETRQATGNDNFGGGFVAGSGGTDRSQANTAFVAIDNVAITTSITTSVITFTGGTYTVLAGDVGNIVQMLTGTNVTAGFYQITSVTTGLNGSWTVDRNVVTSGTTTNATGNMGGALATLNTLATTMVSSNKGFCTGSFTTTASISFSAASVTVSASTPPTTLVGYGSTRGDTGQATLTLQTNSSIFGIYFNNKNGVSVQNMNVNCSSLAGSIGIVTNGTVTEVKNCKVTNFTQVGIQADASSIFLNCEVSGGTSAGTAGLRHTSGPNFTLQCNVHDNGCLGMLLDAGNGTVSRCLFTNNTGASSDGIQTDHQVIIQNNTFHGNGRDGIRGITAQCNQPQSWRNNIFTSNGGYGMTGSNGTAIPATANNDGNAFFNNTSGTRNLMDSVTGIFGVNPYTNVNDVILTGSPYVGPTTGSTANFGLNTTAGAGAACRGAAVPATWPGNTGTTSFADMGAVQHQDPPAGRGGQLLVVQGGITATV